MGCLGAVGWLWTVNLERVKKASAYILVVVVGWLNGIYFLNGLGVYLVS